HGALDPFEPRPHLPATLPGGGHLTLKPFAQLIKANALIETIVKRSPAPRRSTIGYFFLALTWRQPGPSGSVISEYRAEHVFTFIHARINVRDYGQCIFRFWVFSGL